MTLNIGHRGARALAPENTLAAARKAAAVGADAWELDVRYSGDGVLVVIHDGTLKRTSNAAKRPQWMDRRPWRVSEFELVELRELDMGAWFAANPPYVPVEPADRDAARGQPLPTLKEALDLTRDLGLWVNVEIKDIQGQPGHDRIAEETAAAIMEADLADRAWVSSFKWDYLPRVRKAAPRLKTGLLLDFRPDAPLALLDHYGAQAYHVGLKGLDFGHIQELKDAGREVYVWTVNDDLVMMRLLEAGVDGIITDYPNVLARILAEKSSFLESKRFKWF